MNGERNGSRWLRGYKLSAALLMLLAGLTSAAQAEHSVYPPTNQEAGQEGLAGERDAVATMLHSDEGRLDENEAARRETASDPSVRLYRTNAERRGAGIEHEITPWLTVSGLVEVELLAERYRYQHGSDWRSNQEAAFTLQGGMVATPWTGIKGELVVEYDPQGRRLFADEALVSLEKRGWELEGGMLYTPFGAYISHFATGPILEFGETRDRGFKLSYGPDERIELSASYYYGKSRRHGDSARHWDWALAVDAWPRDDLAVGISYQSDLADADDHSSADTDDRFDGKAAGISAYLVWTTPTVEVSLEALGALKRFGEVDSDRDRPVAWNAEFVHFIDRHWEWAVRYEGSSELEDEPHTQAGASLTWRASKNATLTIEYLHGRFRNDFVTDDEDRPYQSVNRVGAQLSVEF